MKALRPICMPAYAPPTQRPRLLNASGMPAESTKLPSISTNSIIRTGRRCGSNQSVTQVVYAQISQVIASSSAVYSVPSRVGCASKRCESWVTANTETKSKNNSTLVTGCPRSDRRRSRLDGAFIGAFLALGTVTGQ